MIRLILMILKQISMMSLCMLMVGGCSLARNKQNWDSHLASSLWGHTGVVKEQSFFKYLALLDF